MNVFFAELSPSGFIRHPIIEVSSPRESRMSDGQAIHQAENVPIVDEDLENLRTAVDEKNVMESAFLHHNKSFTQTLYKQGLKRAIADWLLGDNADSSNGETSVLSLLTHKWISFISELPIGAPLMSNEELGAKFCRTYDWGKSITKAIAWHSQVAKLAVAYSNHSVHIYSKVSPVTPILKHRSQQHVSCLRWQPDNSSVLAVGCNKGVIIWHLDPLLLSARPSGSAVQVLEYPGHDPVASIDWSPDGSLLVSGSFADPTILVWNVAEGRCEPIHRRDGRGNCHVSWSPDANWVVCTTQTNVVRLWNTANWECDKWSSDTQGRWTACAWSSDSSTLLFCGNQVPIIYSLSVNCGATARQIANLNEFLPTQLMNRFGALIVQDMVWNKSSTDLALLVVDSCDASHVLLFSTRQLLTLDLSLSGVILGLPENPISSLSFCETSSQPVITLAWRNGKVHSIAVESLAGGQSTPTAHNTSALYSSLLA